ncbi:MAG: hypothetical protein AAF433_17615 [Bacteroidota bacterium]
MPHNLLDDCLNALSTFEWKQLSHWLNCPLHHAHEPSLKLFEHLYASQLEKGQLPPKDKLPTSWPTGSLSPLQIRKYRSLLLESVESFLAWRQWSRSSEQKPNELLYAYRQRGLFNNLKKRVRSTRRQVKKQQNWGADRLEADFKREEIALVVETMDDRRLVKPFIESENRLLRWQTAERLRKAVSTLARAQTSGSPIPIPLLTAYLELVEATPSLMTLPPISLYYHVCRLYQQQPSDSTDHFAALTELLPQFLEGFPRQEQSDLLKLTINQAIRKINRDPQIETLRIALELYQLGLDRALLFEGGQLSVFTFNNLLGIAFRLQEIDFARSFLYKFGNKLAREHQKEVLAFNTARLCYAEKNYHAALVSLQNIDYQDPFDLLNARMLQIRIYYESEEYQALADLIRATRALLRRRKLGYHQENFRNNLRLTQRLLQLNWSDQQAVHQLEQQIQSTAPLSEREWLIQQLSR